MTKFFEIRNEWDEKLLTSNHEWVNDGRESTKFPTASAAAEVIRLNPDAPRLRAQGWEYDEETGDCAPTGA